MRSFVSLLATTAVAFGATVNYNFNITNAVIAPDGFNRPGVIVNGIFPGTLVQANKDDILHINVQNFLTNPTMRRSTTIHWHGLFQMRTASEDGPAFVTQCPIPPAPAGVHSYEYQMPLNGQPGTFWYHSHLSSQYVDGLRGALIVYDPQDPHLGLYDVDNADTVVVLADWYHTPSIELNEQFFSSDNGGGHEPVPDSGTINGKGRFIGGPATPWARINVQQGLRYRVRLINASAYGFFTFSIAGHSLKIIEVDGVNHDPLTVGSLDIHAGQRYSVVIQANQPIANYWIRAPMSLQHASDNDNLNPDNVFAVLHYSGAPNADPVGSPGSASGTKLEEYNLHELGSTGAPGGSGAADHIIDLNFTKDDDSNDAVTWTVNGIRYESPSAPTLLQILSGARLATDFAQSEHTIILAKDEVVELRIHGSANGHIHPVHLHGHAFHVIKSMSGPTNFVNPPRRDVVGVGGSEVRIRFKADNPGPWFLHCHIDWHLEAGFAVVFAEDPNGVVNGPKSAIIRPEWEGLCTAYDALVPELQ